ncbi:YafY family protein [Pulveribacter sp.]|uniref:helix-turn-helix transcriptional regulator n=1 Tax=Pulveribacter sp. TaxID=2678893 RepID=UPI0028A6A4D1|nr:YafY family protein [Pulveribacter sp.]
MLSSSTRLLRLLALLSTRRHWPGADLAESLQVHPRTLRRDVDRLRQLGYPVHASSGVAGGYAFRAGRDLPPLLLDDEEARAVSIALRTATAAGGMEEPALRALVKLEHAMPTRLRQQMDVLRSAILPLDAAGPVVEAALLVGLASACHEQLRVGFAYTDGQGRGSERSVEPHGLVHAQQRWYLVAWDCARGDWRTFRVDRIEGAPRMGGHFAPRPSPDGGDLKAYVARSLTAPLAQVPARIVLHAPHAQLARRIPASAGTLRPLGDHSCELECATHAPCTLVYWLMALEVDFQVLAPDDLVDRVRAAAERALRGCTGVRPEAPVHH